MYICCNAIYNLIGYIDNYLKTSGSLWQYYRDDPNDNITESESFKYKIKIMGKTPDAGNTKNAQIAVPLKYLSNFWITSEMPLINCKINLILTWSEDCFISSATGKTKFKITNQNLYNFVLKYYQYKMTQYNTLNVKLTNSNSYCK